MYNKNYDMFLFFNRIRLKKYTKLLDIFLLIKYNIYLFYVYFIIKVSFLMQRNDTFVCLFLLYSL